MFTETDPYKNIINLKSLENKHKLFDKHTKDRKKKMEEYIICVCFYFSYLLLFLDMTYGFTCTNIVVRI